MTTANRPIEFSDDELDAFLQGIGIDEQEDTSETGDVEPTEELLAVARRIAGQYAEVIIRFAGSMFSGKANKGVLDQLDAALASLTRLALASGDTLQHGLLIQLQQRATDFRGERRRGVGQQRFLHWLRQWIKQFAGCLDGEDARRVRGLVEFEEASIPLFQDLKSIRGIAEKRLLRLYCAGLYTVDAIGEADPEELASLTGIPRQLAAEVVLRTQDYAVVRRRRCVLEMRARARELAQQLDLAGDFDPDLLSIAQDTLRELHGVLSRFSEEA